MLSSSGACEKKIEWFVMLKSIRFSKIVKLLQSGKWISGTQQNRKYFGTGSRKPEADQI